MNNRPECGAKTKSGNPCRSTALYPNGRCWLHGGKTPKGLASPNLKHGRYSKDLPTRLAARYEAATTDPDLLALQAEIALIDARLGDLLGRVDTGEAGIHWKVATKAFADLQIALDTQDPVALARSMQTLQGSLRSGMGDYAAWNEVYNLVDHRRRLVESERKRQIEAQQVLPLDRAMLVISALVDIVRRHVTDQDQILAIGADVGKLLTVNVSGTVDPNGQPG